MKCTILLHSTTGNTRLVTRYAVSRLEALGVACTTVDIVHQPEPPPLDEVELLVVSSPTMYFRPTLAMERFVALLPAVSGPKPAVLLATASGETGAHFPILAELLRPRGWVTVGARFVPCVNNWPPHRSVVKLVGPFQSIAATAGQLLPGLFEELSFVWPDLGEAQPRHRDGLQDFLAEMVRRVRSGEPIEGFAPLGLRVGGALTAKLGHHMTAERMAQSTRIRIAEKACSRCGVCVKVCPVHCITSAGADAVPRVGAGCTGCWTCFQHCPDRAISGLLSPRGSGRYPGPSAAMRELFRV